MEPSSRPEHRPPDPFKDVRNEQNDIGVRVTKRAWDGKQGMTFAELREAVQAAMRMDLPDHAPVEAVVGFKGQVKQVVIG